MALGPRQPPCLRLKQTLLLPCGSRPGATPCLCIPVELDSCAFKWFWAHGSSQSFASPTKRQDWVGPNFQNAVEIGGNSIKIIKISKKMVDSTTSKNLNGSDFLNPGWVLFFLNAGFGHKNTEADMNDGV
jgi:hypothetical protein